MALARFTLLALSVAAAAPVGSGALAQAGGAPRSSCVAEILAAEDTSTLQVASELRALGPTAIPELIDALDALSRAAAPPEGRQLAVLDALASQPRSDLDQALAARASGEQPMEPRRAALRALEQVGDAENLCLAALELARPVPEDPRATAELAAALEHCVTAVAARDARAFGKVEALLPRVPPELRAGLVRGAARAGGERSLKSLVAMLGADASVDACLLSSIGELAARSSGDHRLIVGRVRRYLESTDPQLVREAALACAKLGDSQAVPALIALLERPERALRQTARWSLTCLTGLRFRVDPARWRSWLAREQAWWAEHGDETIAKLASASTGTVLGALNELACHPLERDASAEAIASLLGHGESAVVGQACASLAALGARRFAAEIERLAADDDERVAGAARDALSRLRKPLG